VFAGEDPRLVFGGCGMNLRSLVFAESEELRLDHIYYLILGLNFNSHYSLTLLLKPCTFFVSCSLYSVPFLIATQPSPSRLTRRLHDRCSLDILQQSFRHLFEVHFCLCVPFFFSFTKEHSRFILAFISCSVVTSLIYCLFYYLLIPFNGCPAAERRSWGMVREHLVFQQKSLTKGKRIWCRRRLREENLVQTQVSSENRFFFFSISVSNFSPMFT